MDPRAAALLRELELYAPSASDSEKESLDAMLAFVSTASDPLSRTSSTSHVTGSAIIRRRIGGTFLLIHHRKLDRWLQPGGHVDPEDPSVLETALREAREETRATDLEIDPAREIFDVDVHPIPARARRPAHIHYDVRYLFSAQAEALRGQPEEVRGVAWFSFEEALARGVDPSLARALRKALARFGGGPTPPLR
jgi:8-oxo-dGTP pyrophosphatase MutT (NUDIX family)